MRSDITYRTIEVIREVVDGSRRTKELEEETGIPSTSWKNVWNKKQRPTIHMIEALSRRWPQFAFWLVTGITDEGNGHTAPKGAWTCNQDKATEEVEIAAREYFDLKIFYQNLTYGMDEASANSYTKEDVPNQQTDSDTQRFVENFPKDLPKSEPKKKLTELDYAIAEIAFNRRQKSLSAHFFECDDAELSIRYCRLIEELQTARQDAGKRAVIAALTQHKGV